MSWIENLRNKPHKEKVRLIWLSALGVAVFLIIVWVLTSKITKSRPKDITLFQTIGRGIKDIRENFRK